MSKSLLSIFLILCSLNSFGVGVGVEIYFSEGTYERAQKETKTFTLRNDKVKILDADMHMVPITLKIIDPKLDHQYFIKVQAETRLSLLDEGKNFPLLDWKKANSKWIKLTSLEGNPVKFNVYKAFDLEVPAIKFEAHEVYDYIIKDKTAGVYWHDIAKECTKLEAKRKDSELIACGVQKSLIIYEIYSVKDEVEELIGLLNFKTAFGC